MANGWAGSGGQNFREREAETQTERQRDAKNSDTGDFPVGRDTNRQIKVEQRGQANHSVGYKLVSQVKLDSSLGDCPS